MREIKFRFVCKDLSGEIFFLYYRLNDFVNGLSLGDIGRIQEIISIDQFIGLKDKNNVEIYEEDILHYKGYFYEILHNILNRGKTIKVEVDNNFPVKFDDNKGFQMYHQGIGYYKIHSVDVEIVGNIYKNLELIKE